jgi:hypothetical protein
VGIERRTLFDLMDERPLVPFEIELDNGRRVEVRHPEQVIIVPNRAKPWYVMVYDEAADRMVHFGPSAVSEILRRRAGGSGAG